MGREMDAPGYKERIIRDTLIYCARRRTTITYGDLGDLVGRTSRGPWAELDRIKEREKKAGKPDLTLLVISSRTELPTKYRGKPLHRNDRERVEMYREDREHVYRCWGKDGRGVSRSSEPDTMAARAAFLKEARRQSLAVAASPQEKEDQDFIDAISVWNER